MTTYYGDISGLLHAQQNYLSSLSLQNDVSGQLLTINSGLDELAKKLNSNSAAYVLTGQEKVYDIVNNEQNRLTTKKSSIDNAIQGQKRLVELNDSYAKKNWQWAKIGMILCVCFLLILGVLIINKFIDIPDVFLNLITIILLSVSFCWCVYIYYYDIYIRDSLYHDKLSSEAPILLNPKSVSDDIKNHGITTTMNGSSFGGLCVGSSCCDISSNYNTQTQTCVTECGPNKYWYPDSNKCEAAACDTSTYTLLIKEAGNKICTKKSETFVSSMNQQENFSPDAFHENEFEKYQKYNKTKKT